MMRWAALTAAVAGALGVVLVTELVGMTPADSVALATPAVGAALVASAFGTLHVVLMRRKSIAAQTVVVALTSVAAVAVGASFAARAMFWNAHDIGALMVILVAAGTVSTVFALLLGRRIAVQSSTLGATARRIGAGEKTEKDAQTGSREFTTLAEDLEQMSLQLDAARDRELTLDRSRRELVAWVSHDLRTPLAGIRAMAEALEDGVVSDEPTIRRYHQTMRVEVDRLAGLVNDLFELSRINSGALRLQIEEVSLEDLVSDAMAATADMARSKGIHLEGRVTGDIPSIPLSEPEIARVLRNLLENAIHHTASEGSVSIETGNETEHAFVSVSDTCGGIPKEDIDRVFEQAFRGQSARTPGAHGGGGLGLAIARGIVEAHSGRIEVHNEGDGCRFTVRLPLEQPSH